MKVKNAQDYQLERDFRTKRQKKYDALIERIHSIDEKWKRPPRKTLKNGLAEGQHFYMVNGKKLTEEEL